MIEMNTNPDVETLKLVLGISGSVIGLLLLVIGYFISQQFGVLKALQKTVSELGTIVEVIKAQYASNATSCSATHRIIDKRLEVFDQKIDEHETEIAVLKTKMDAL